MQSSTRSLELRASGRRPMSDRNLAKTRAGATLWARGYVDACAADAHDAAVRRGRDAVVAVAAAGGAAIVATTLSCLLAELSGVGRTHLGVARARRAAARHRFGGGGAVACGA